jgi:hypothetical protein
MPDASNLVILAEYRLDKETGDALCQASVPTGGKLVRQMRVEYRCQEYQQYLQRVRTILGDPKLNKRQRRLLIHSEAAGFRSRQWCCQGCRSAGRKLPKWLSKPAAKQAVPPLRLAAGSVIVNIYECSVGGS